MRQLVLLIALVMTLSQCQIMTIVGQDKMACQHKLGGWQQVKFTNMQQLFTLPLFTQADYLALIDFYQEFQIELDVISKVYKQIVNGINYKIIYQTPCGLVFYIIYANIIQQSVTIIDKGNLPTVESCPHL